MDTQSLVDAARRGEAAAGPMIVSYFAPALIDYVRILAPRLSTADVEEAAEEALERAVARIQAYDKTRGTLFGWLRGFARTVVRERGTRRVPKLSLDTLQIAAPVTSPDPDQGNTADREVAAAVARVTSQLTPTDQLVLSLRASEQFPYQVIADRLGVSEGACRVRYLRAVRRFRSLAGREPALRRLLEGGPTS